jgi:hypothetical protein
MLRCAAAPFIGGSTEPGTGRGSRYPEARGRVEPSLTRRIQYLYPYFSLYRRISGRPYASPMEERQATEQDGGPGIRDAEEILLRAHEDELLALEARARYRADGLPILDVDGAIDELLRPDEAVVDIRPSAVINRHLRDDGYEDFPGRLYLTNQRLMIVGRAPLAIELGEIEELALAGERLLVTLRDGTGLSIEASRPRLLRVLIAAALHSARGEPAA